MFCSNCGAKNDDGYKFCMKCGSPLEDGFVNQNGASYGQQSPYAGSYGDNTQVLSEDDLKSIQSFAADEPEDNTVMLDDVMQQDGFDDTYPRVDVTEEPEDSSPSWGNSYGSSYGNAGQKDTSSQYDDASSQYHQTQNNYGNQQAYVNAGNDAAYQMPYQSATDPTFQDDYQRKPALDGPVRLKTGGAFLIMFLGYMPMLWALLYVLILATGTLIAPELGIGVYCILGLAYAIFIIILACLGGKAKSRAAMCRGMILNAVIRFVITLIFMILIYYIGADTMESLIRELQSYL